MAAAICANMARISFSARVCSRVLRYLARVLGEGGQLLMFF